VWNLKIPSEQIDLNISSIINDSEVDARLTTYLTYWEGAVNIKGSHTGQGFMESKGEIILVKIGIVSMMQKYCQVSLA
jgi:predicted secreted hydrolase